MRVDVAINTRSMFRVSQYYDSCDGPLSCHSLPIRMSVLRGREGEYRVFTRSNRSTLFLLSLCQRFCFMEWSKLARAIVLALERRATNKLYAKMAKNCRREGTFVQTCREYRICKGRYNVLSRLTVDVCGLYENRYWFAIEALVTRGVSQIFV